MFKQVLLAFVICTAAFGYWKLPLNYKEIKETGTALYPIDAVYLFNSEMGQGSTTVKVASILDSTQEKNWFITDKCSDSSCPADGDKYVCKDPCVSSVGSQPIVAVDAFADRAKISEATVGKNKVNINSVNFGSPDIYFATKLDKNDFTLLLSTVRAGWGVGKGSSSFLNYVASKVKIESTGYSFNLHSSIAAAIFGGKQQFFADGAFAKFENEGVHDWQLTGASLKVNADELKGFSGLKAVFDTTTEWIWVPQALLDNLLTNFRNSYGDQCAQDTDIKNKVYLCACNDKYPDLKFTFNQNEKVFTLKKEHYLKKLDNGKCLLLIRGAKTATSARVLDATATPTGTTTTPAPAPTTQIYIPNTQGTVFLGTSFLKSVYVYFDGTHNTLSLANSYPIVLESTNIKPQYRFTFLVVGILLGVFAVAFLLKILHKVPYDESMAPKPVVKVEEKSQKQSQVMQVQNVQVPIQQQVVPPRFVQQSGPLPQYIYSLPQQNQVQAQQFYTIKQ